LDDLPFLIPLHIVAFLGLLVASTAAYNIKVLVLGVSVDRYALHRVAVKFDGGLSITVLRNKQLFKKRRSKAHFQSLEFLIFQTPLLEERTDHILLEKVSLFWISFFL
jgi:hypothetical protein